MDGSSPSLRFKLSAIDHSATSPNTLAETHATLTRERFRLVSDNRLSSCISASLKWCRICFLRLPASSPTIPAEQGLFAYGIPSGNTLHGYKLHCSLGRNHPSSACHVHRTCALCQGWSIPRDSNPQQSACRADTLAIASGIEVTTHFVSNLPFNV